IGHGQFAMEVDGVVQQAAPIVRLAQHAETLRQLGDFHAAGDPAQVIDNEPYFVERSEADVLGVIVRRENELAHGNGNIQSLDQLGEALHIVGGQTIFVGDVVQ